MSEHQRRFSIDRFSRSASMDNVVTTDTSDSFATSSSAKKNGGDRLKLSRQRRVGSISFDGNSIFGSLSQRIHGKKNLPPQPQPSSLSVQNLAPPLHHDQHRGHHIYEGRRKPMIIYYNSNPPRRPSAENNQEEDNFAADLLSVRRRTTNKSLDVAETPRSHKMVDGGANSNSPTVSSHASTESVGSTSPPSDAATASTSSISSIRQSRTLRRLSKSIMSSPPHHRRQSHADHKSAKYDVPWRNDDECSCCQICFAMFKKLSRRRHHCRVCGDLICSDCSVDQVQLTAKFSTPKRACVACFTLLEVMLHHGDPRVSMDDHNNNRPPSRSTVNDDGRVAARTSVADDDNFPKIPSTPTAPLPTPRYRDRLQEVHRVMAAGKLSQRTGSTRREMYVISSKWLRSWLAFTKSSEDSSSSSNNTNNLSYEDDFSSSRGFSHSTTAHTNSGLTTPRMDMVDHLTPPPEAIANLSLLELLQGKLVQRAGLVRDDQLEHDQAEGDYQYISSEVWDVFQRLYGGGPTIRVQMDNNEENANEWIVDINAMLTLASTKGAVITPAVHQALTKRHHQPVAAYSCNPVTSGRYRSADNSTPHSLTGSTISRRGSRSPVSSQYGASERGSFMATTSSISPAGSSKTRVASNSSSADEEVTPQLSNDKLTLEMLSDDDEPTAAKQSQSSQNESSSDQSLSMSTSNLNRHQENSRNHQQQSDKPKAGQAAVTAASAFAIAMKQARLNAQKALDDRSKLTA